MKNKKYKLLKDYPPYEKGDVIVPNNQSNLTEEFINKYPNLFEEVIYPSQHPKWLQRIGFKLITEEGDKLYGDDKCWIVNSNLTSVDNFNNKNFNNWQGISESDKYFSKKENAEQFFAELLAKERGIEIGTEMFGYVSSELKHYRKVTSIKFHRNHGSSEFLLGTEEHPRPIYATVMYTLEELVKKEGLEIGMQLPSELINAWCYTYYEGNYSIKTPLSIIKFSILDSQVWFGDGKLSYRLIGFKKFKEEWELKQKGFSISNNPNEFKARIKKGDVDVQMNVLSSHPLLAKDKKLCVKTMKGIIASKKLEFEVGKWYKHKKSTALVYYKDRESPGWDSYRKWSENVWVDDAHQWGLADMEEVEERLLNYAKKKYPIDTIFKSVHVNTDYKSDGYFLFHHASSTVTTVNKDIFFQGKWAEIIEPKKWSVGTYVVYIKSNSNRYSMGNISKIYKSDTINGICTDFGTSFMHSSSFAINNVKWFATKEEAEKFAETLKPKLMLGKYSVAIEKESICARNSRVSFKQWLTWYEGVRFFRCNSKQDYITTDISNFEYTDKYETSIFNNKEYTDDISIHVIGCIENIRWKQIEEVTKAIEKL